MASTTLDPRQAVSQSRRQVFFWLESNGGGDPGRTGSGGRRGGHGMGIGGWPLPGRPNGGRMSEISDTFPPGIIDKTSPILANGRASLSPVPPPFSIRSSQEHSKAVLILLAVVMRMLISPASIRWTLRMLMSTFSASLMGSAEVSKQLSAIADIKRKPLNEAQLRE